MWSLCPGNGTYRCTECFGSPLYCTSCCRDHHSRMLFHQIKQWTGEFFETAALHLVGSEHQYKIINDILQAGFVLHLGHEGRPCPLGSIYGEIGDSNPISIHEDDWGADPPTSLPMYLRHPEGADYMTIVDVSGVHFLEIKYCACPDSSPFHLQLMGSRLFPCTMEAPKTAFTFDILDDFLQDNLECGTLACNYYSKIC